MERELGLDLPELKDFKNSLPEYTSLASQPIESVETLAPEKGFETEAKRSIEVVRERLSQVLGEIEGSGIFVDQLTGKLEEQAAYLSDAAGSVKEGGSFEYLHKGQYTRIDSPEVLALHSNKFVADLQTFGNKATDFKVMQSNLRLLENYIADYQTFEKVKDQPLDVTFIRSEQSSSQRERELFPCLESYTKLGDRADYAIVQDFIDPEQLGDYENKTIVFNVDNPNELFQHYDTKVKMVRLYSKLKYMDRQGNAPTIIFLTDKPVDPIERNNFPAFHFCESTQFLPTALYTARQVAYAKENREAYMEPEALSVAQRELYEDAVEDLREWENKTANTEETLRHFLRFQQEKIDELDSKSPPFLKRKRSWKMLDIGTGSGRISSKLAMLGNEVYGMDISQNQLDSITAQGGRVDTDIQEAQGNQSVLNKLAEEGIVDKNKIVTDKEAVTNNLKLFLGNFATLYPDVAKAIGRTEPIGEYQAVTLNWHVFCEAGDVLGQKLLLEQIYLVLQNGGYVYIEIPDRGFSKYKDSLDAYHALHSKEPFGTIRDITSQEEGVPNEVTEQGTPRFFPDKDALFALMREVGFTELEADTYVVASDSQGKKSFELKELILTAKKPTF